MWYNTKLDGSDVDDVMCFQRDPCFETGIEAFKATFRDEMCDEINLFPNAAEGEDRYCTSSDEGENVESDAEVDDGQSESDVDVDDTQSESDVDVDDNSSNRCVLIKSHQITFPTLLLRGKNHHP